MLKTHPQIFKLSIANLLLALNDYYNVKSPLLATKDSWYELNMSAISPYKQFIAEINSINKMELWQDIPKVLFLWGSSDYLLFKSHKLFTSNWQSLPNCECSTYNPEDLKTLDPETLFEQNSFFAPKSLLFFAHAEQSESWWGEYLKRTSSDVGLSAKICFFYKGAKLTEKLKSSLESWGAKLIHCVEPDHKELPLFVAGLCKKYGLDLDTEGQQLLRNCVGENLATLENEIKRLGLVFAKHKAVSVQELNEHLGLLKEELIFKLQNFLVKGQSDKADLLVGHLLHRGESEFALIGVIAKHCRTVLKIAHNPHVNMGAVGIRNVYQFNDYKHACGNPLYVDRAARTLALCASADKILKSKKISEHLIVANIVNCLLSA